MDWPTQIGERRIREAMERGRFNDSPLKGTKLVFKVNPYVPEELRLAYKLLKDAGLIPREMEIRKEIRTLKEMLRTIDDENPDASRGSDKRSGPPTQHALETFFLQ